MEAAASTGYEGGGAKAGAGVGAGAGAAAGAAEATGGDAAGRAAAATGCFLAMLALRNRVPTLFYAREFANAGGLASYGGNLTESHRLSGQYAGRIIKGEKPGDLPVQQVTRVELIINLKTALALGIDVPRQLVARADEVIE